MYRARRLDMDTGLKDWSVVQLLHRFRNKKCATRRDRIYSLLALCHEAKTLEVDYGISEEQVLRQVLALWEESTCLCSATITTHALAPWDFTALEDDLVEKPFAELHMYASTLSSSTCAFCLNWVPFSWTRKKGLVFCLRTACPDTQGHLFWEHLDDNDRPIASDAGASQRSMPGSIYMQLRQNNKSHWLCRNEAGIYIVSSQWKHVYLLRFTLRMLVEVLQGDSTTGDLDLNACGNLWPSKSNHRTSDEARLRLCEEVVHE